MNRIIPTPTCSVLAAGLLAVTTVQTQPAPADPPLGQREAMAGPGGFDGPPGFGPGGFGRGGFGPGGPGGMHRETKVVAEFDLNRDGCLNTEERKAAREWLKTQGGGRRFGGPGGPRGRFGGPGGSPEAPQPGRKLTPADVQSYPDSPVYDPLTVRTFFLQFENADWEQELADFHNTDVEVPAQVTVDGRKYADVGVHFRGSTSFMFAGEGRKRPLNLSFDFQHKEQNLGGYRTFNLLNSNEDPSFLRAVLYLQIARDYIPAAKANFVRVVINGESWGIYINVQQFNKDFVQDWFGTTKGARWKVPGSPGTRAGLEYRGDDPEEYRQLYQIKTKETPEVWTEFIKLCRVLNQTKPSELKPAIEPLLDVDGALRFLAVDAALINNDGYWVRSSDYNIYEDKTGKFHVIPHDINEGLASAGGPGFGGPGGGMAGRRGRGGPDGFGPNASGGAGFRRGPGGDGGGVQLDPLIGLDDSTKPLRSKLLAVPEYRARYLGHVRDIATKWLAWERLGPIARQYHDLIADDVKADTRKLDTTEAFLGSLEGSPASATAGSGPGGDRGFRGGREKMSLKAFAEQRRAYLLSNPDVKAATAERVSAQ